MQVEFDYLNSEYYIEENHNNQTYKMSFYFDNDWKRDPQFFSVYLRIFSKRKQEHKFENELMQTGKNIFFTYKWALRALTELEDVIIKEELPRYKKIIINIHWLDKRRRDAYYKVLSKRGYSFNNYGGGKVLSKELIRPHSSTD